MVCPKFFFVLIQYEMQWFSKKKIQLLSLVVPQGQEVSTLCGYLSLFLSLPMFSFLSSLFSLRLLCAGPSVILGPLSPSPDCQGLIPDVVDLDFCPPGDSTSPLVPVSCVVVSFPFRQI